MAKTQFDEEPTIRLGASLSERVASVKLFTWKPRVSHGCFTSEENKLRNELLSLQDLPLGYGIQLDRSTQNYVVYGPKLAFCVVPIAVQSGMHLTDYVLVLERLIAAHG